MHDLCLGILQFEELLQLVKITVWICNRPPGCNLKVKKINGVEICHKLDKKADCLMYIVSSWALSLEWILSPTHLLRSFLAFFFCKIYGFYDKTRWYKVVLESLFAFRIPFFNGYSIWSFPQNVIFFLNAGRFWKWDWRSLCYWRQISPRLASYP